MKKNKTVYRPQKRGRTIDCSAAVQPSRTKQHCRAECDINSIVARIRGGQQIPDGKNAVFADVTGLQMDYMEAMNFVADVNERFWSLMPALRMRFNNNPAAALAFVENPANRAECIKLGLIREEKKAETSVPPEQKKGPSEEAPTA